MNNLILGMNTIAALLGYNKFGNVDFNKNDIQIISEKTNIFFDKKEERFSGEKARYNIYTFEGENRYICIEFENNYLIYDKQDNIIKELNNGVSPYNKYTDYLCFYADFNNQTIHGYVDEKSYFCIDQNSYFNDIIGFLNESVTYGGVDNYELFDDYGSDVKKCNNAFYFEYLYDLHGYNIDDTCVPIAAQILFGYYDTFYNDNIIDESFDVDTQSNYPSNPLDEYSYSPGSDERFHQYLISFCKEKDIDDDAAWLSFDESKELMMEYLKSRNIEANYTYVNGNWSDATSNRAANHIKESIDRGNPIYLGVSKHASIVYAYDSQYVYVHSGWGDVRRISWSLINTNLFNVFGIGAPVTFEISSFASPHVHSDNYVNRYDNTWACGYCKKAFDEVKITPNMYGFESQYFYSVKEKKIETGKLTINTKRLRTGYIENQFINLSPRKADAGLAYLEYNLVNKQIKKIKFNLSLWSGAEQLNVADSRLEFQYCQNGAWFIKQNLLDPTYLSYDRSHQKEYEIIFNEPISTFRFYSTSSAIGERNKGRSCVGDMYIRFY